MICIPIYRLHYILLWLKLTIYGEYEDTRKFSCGEIIED
jgi:hypothetical protein